MIPENFTLTTYRFTLQALEPLILPPFKTSALRGGFGHALKRLACEMPKPCHKRCQAGNACAYGYIFETSLPDHDPALARRLNRFATDMFRPFLLVDSGNRRTKLAAGERFTFGLTLIGGAIRMLPTFVALFHALGEMGLGKNRGQYRLERVEALDPYGSQGFTMYEAAEGYVYASDLHLSGAQVLARAAALGQVDQVALTFLSPTQLTQHGKPLWQGPPFQVLVRSLLDRVEVLSVLHCGQDFAVDFGGLLRQAATVSLAVDETYEESWRRFSNRQQETVRVDGLVGQVIYEGDITPFLPLLLLGELIHVGKKTVFGNGRYEVQVFGMEREQG